MSLSILLQFLYCCLTLFLISCQSRQITVDPNFIGSQYDDICVAPILLDGQSIIARPFAKYNDTHIIIHGSLDGYAYNVYMFNTLDDSITLIDELVPNRILFSDSFVELGNNNVLLRVPDHTYHIIGTGPSVIEFAHEYYSVFEHKGRIFGKNITGSIFSAFGELDLLTGEVIAHYDVPEMCYAQTGLADVGDELFLFCYNDSVSLFPESRLFRFDDVDNEFVQVNTSAKFPRVYNRHDVPISHDGESFFFIDKDIYLWKYNLNGTELFLNTTCHSIIPLNLNGKKDGITLKFNSGGENLTLTKLSTGEVLTDNLQVPVLEHIEYKNKFYFTGGCHESRKDPFLCISDGTSQGTSIVSDTIVDPQHYFIYGDFLFFTAYHPAYGRELFRFDGSSITLVYDIFLGSSSSNPTNFIEVGGHAYFIAKEWDIDHMLRKIFRLDDKGCLSVNQTVVYCEGTCEVTENVDPNGVIIYTDDAVIEENVEVGNIVVQGNAFVFKGIRANEDFSVLGHVFLDGSTRVSGKQGSLSIGGCIYTSSRSGNSTLIFEVDSSEKEEEYILASVSCVHDAVELEADISTGDDCVIGKGTPLFNNQTNVISILVLYENQCEDDIDVPLVVTVVAVSVVLVTVASIFVIVLLKSKPQRGI